MKRALKKVFYIQKLNKFMEMKYEEAYHELQGIVRQMEGEELDIDQMAEAVKRAQELIKLCKDKLTKTDENIRKILAQD